VNTCSKLSTSPWFGHAGISAGTMVRGCVLEPADTATDDTAAAGGAANGKGSAALRLSLRASNGGAVAGRSDPPGTAAGPGAGGTPRQPEVGDKVRETSAFSNFDALLV
jgi:hypothetical protein